MTYVLHMAKLNEAKKPDIYTQNAFNFVETFRYIFSFLGDKSSVRMTEVVTRVRELAFYSAKHCNCPDVFPKDSMFFPDQPRHILYIHLFLFHVRSGAVFPDLHLSWPTSVFLCCPEDGDEKSTVDLDLCQVVCFFSVLIFCYPCIHLHSEFKASPACVDSLSRKGTGYCFL